MPSFIPVSRLPSSVLHVPCPVLASAAPGAEAAHGVMHICGKRQWEGGDEYLRRWEPSLCRLGSVMHICGIEAAGSGRSREKDSEARAQVPATAHGRPAGHGTRAGQSRSGIFAKRNLISPECCVRD